MSAIPFIVFDSDASRSETLARLVRDLGEGVFVPDIVKSVQGLRRLPEKGPSVLAVGARDAWGERTAIELVEALLKSHHDLHAVFLDDEPTAAYEVCGVHHALLLPRVPEREHVAAVLAKLRQRLQEWTGMPLLVKAHTSEHVVIPNHIWYVESNRRILRIHAGDEVMRTYGKLTEFMGLMPRHFFQCHKSFLVNLAMVERLEHDCLVLTNGETVPVSQKRRKQTHDALASLVREL